jgi:hypothetical protein
VLLALLVAESGKLMGAIRDLVRHPARPGGFFGRDPVRRSLSAITVEKHEIVFWVDHAAKEVRIVGVFSD